MKILNIKLKNLNSLKGEWHINLTDSIYSLNGIFAITGSTGAGKTTIFDAICLALYGQTPRLNTINNSSNEIMSRRTRECFANVEFEVEGKRYLASWSQTKAPNSNKLQNIKHTLSDPESGEILSEKKNNETVKKIFEITGLDFKRFKQAVMLEQGGFDAFLKANASERSQILELLTGTEIYGEISTSVYERADFEKRKLDDIKLLISNKKPIDNFNSEEEIQTELEKSNSELSNLESKHENDKKILDQLKTIDKIKFELAQNQDAIIQFMKQVESFAADKRRLDFGLKANELTAEYLNLTSKRTNCMKQKNDCEKLKNLILNDTSEASKINDKLPDFEFELKRRLRGLKENEVPEAVHAKAKELLKRFSEIELKSDTITKEGINSKRKLDKLKENLQKARKNYKSACDTYESAMKNLYEYERMKLREGEPCPVCGSFNHPYVKSYIHDEKSRFPSLDETRKNFDEAGKVVNELERQYFVLSERLEHLRSEYLENEKAKSDIQLKTFEIINPLGILGRNFNEINSKLDFWLKEVRDYSNEIEKTTKRLDSLNTQIKTNKKLLLEENSNFETITNKLEIMENDFKTSLNKKNFNDEDQFKASRLNQNELEKLLKRERELEDKNKELQAINENIKKRLEIEISKLTTTETLEEREAKFKSDEEKIKYIQKLIGSLENALKYRIKLKSELEELNHEYEAQNKICENWAALNNLIGQKDGGKFRAFAQKITLKMMIKLANIQLEKMNGRYSLISRPGDKDKELNLSVIDNEQAGEIRPTENLSGGESFIVSLALALSLSQISGNKTKIDSLFLDEGFGSLDEEALNTALEALGELKNEGKIVGIISHVPALKERIAAQINVIPQHEGVSILEGAGVLKV